MYYAGNYLSRHRFLPGKWFIQYTDFFSNDEVIVSGRCFDHAIISERERILGENNGSSGSGQYKRVFNQMVNMWYDYPQVKFFAFNHQLAETTRSDRSATMFAFIATMPLSNQRE